MSIVVIGSVFVDIKGYPSRTYIPGGRNAGKVRYVHGGVCRNIAEDLGNLGLDPVFLSLVDCNGAGEDVLIRLREHGVDTRYVGKVPDGMGTWLAVFDNNNDVCASISNRPDLAPLLTLLQANGNDLFSCADSILLELDLDEPVVEERTVVQEQAPRWPVAEPVEPTMPTPPVAEETVRPTAQPAENGVEAPLSAPAAVQPTQKRKKMVKMIVVYDDHSFAEYYPE